MVCPPFSHNLAAGGRLHKPEVVIRSEVAVWELATHALNQELCVPPALLSD
jgi:hypothetical protein